VPNYRIYANRQDGLPWSIDSGTQADEIQVKDAKGYGISLSTLTHFSVQSGDEDHPKWMVIVEYAILRVDENQVAHFFHDPNWTVPPIETK
jgi:hypothetical protein